MNDPESDKKAAFAKDIGRAQTQIENTFRAMEAMGSKRGRIPSPEFAVELRKDPEGKHFSFSMMVSKPRAWLTPFLHWADCNAPHLAGKTREHLDRLLEYGMKSDDVLRSPPTADDLLSGTAGVAVSDWLTFWAHLQATTDFLRELQPAVERHTAPSDARAVVKVAAEEMLRANREAAARKRDAPNARRGKRQADHLQSIAPAGGKASAMHDDAAITAAFKKHKSDCQIQGITHAVAHVSELLGYSEPLWKRVKAIAAPLRPSAWYKTL